MKYYLQQTIDYITAVSNYIPSIFKELPKKKESISNFSNQGTIIPMTSPFVRLAGLSGAAAIVLAAYGSHCK